MGGAGLWLHYNEKSGEKQGGKGKNGRIFLDFSLFFRGGFRGERIDRKGTKGRAVLFVIFTKREWGGLWIVLKNREAKTKLLKQN